MKILMGYHLSKLRLLAIAAVLITLSLLPARAVVAIRLSADNGATWTTVFDGDALDLSPTDGSVVFFGSVGSWTMNVSAGISKPLVGLPSIPYMDLNSQNTSSGNGKLIVQISDNDFAPVLPSGQKYIARIGGTTAGTVTYTTWADGGNVQFAKVTPLTSLGAFPGPVYSGEAVASAGPSGAPYSLTSEVIINHVGNGNTGFDAELSITNTGGCDLPPTITCPAAVNVQCASAVPAPNPAQVVAIDNCNCGGPVAVTWQGDSTAPGACVNQFIITRTYQATDACGHTATCTQTITVNDTTPPTLQVPGNIAVACDAVPAPGDASAIDNCDANPLVSYLGQTRANGNCAGSYVLTRSWKATDACGNAVTNSQIITVTDTTAPVITSIPSGGDLGCNPATLPTDASITALVVAGDACGTATVRVSSVDSANGCSVTRTFSISAVDDCGNATIPVTVAYTWKNDTTAPVLSTLPPATASYQCLSDVPAPPAVTALDDCDGNLVPVYSESRTGDACNLVITRRWSAVDACGNPVSFTQTISVRDTIAPVAPAAPAEVVGQCDSEVPAPASLTAMDNCSGAIVAQPVDSRVNDTAGCGYTITRTWTFVDNCNNTATVSQTIRIKDTTAPVTPAAPADVVGQCDSEVPAPVSLTAMDNCSGAIVAQPVDSRVNDTTGCGYTITRTWTFVDNCNNTASVSQTIRIKDTTAPVTPAAPADVVGQCDSDVPAPASLTAMDNCSGALVAQPVDSRVNDTAGCGYTITRTWTFVDNCGNTASVSQSIRIKDTTAPVTPAAPANVTGQCDSDVPAPVSLTAMDNCSGAIVAQPVDSRVNDTTGCGYTITRTWTFVDNCGNTASVSQSIRIKDTVAPSLTVPADASVECGSALPAVGADQATDNCSVNPIVTYLGSVTNGAGCNYTITRTWKAVDSCGNEVSKSQVITVRDTTPPVINCASDVIITNCQPLLFCSYTPGGWGCPPSGSSPGAILAANFATVYPGGFIEIGIPGAAGYSLKFNSALAVQNFLPAGGTPGVLTADAVNPLTSSAGVLASHVLALKLNVDFSAAGFIGGSSGPLGNLVLNDPSSPFNGQTISQILAAANTILGGGTISGVTPESIKSLAASFNEGWDNCQTSPWVLARFALTSCTTNIVTTPTATDNCDPHPTISYRDEGTTGACATTIRIWTAVDACGNTSTCTQQVALVDNIAPQLTVPANVTVECGSALPAVGTATATDNRDPNPVVTYLGQTQNGSGCSYTIIRTWKAVDSCGNEATKSQTITVRDTTAPVIVTVPAGGEIDCNALPTIASVRAQVVATDACGTVTVNVTSMDSSSACQTNRTFTITATDGCNTSAARTVVYTATCGNNSCVPVTFNFNGSTAMDGTDGNIRTFTTNGVSVRVSSWSRDKATGAWAPAFTGQYGGGLGVTDSSEGDGSGNAHTVDNLGRVNYVLFEFSQPVVINKAYLGYVVTDSDLSLWVGNFADPYNNHLALNDATVSAFGYTEENLTDLTTTRWADLNAGAVSGNAILLAALASDTSPEDQFKIGLMEVCKPACEPVCLGSIAGSVLRDCDADGYLTGEQGFGGWTVTLKNSTGTTTLATTNTSSNGSYSFGGLAAGSYLVVVTPAASHTQTYDADATKDGKTLVTIASCENKTGVNFAYTGTAPGVNLVVKGPATAECGTTITYTFAVTNTGNTCLYGGMRVESALLGGQIFHQTPVNPGQGYVFTKTYLVKSTDAGTLVLSATVIGDPPGSLANVSKTVSVSTTVSCTPCLPPPTCVVTYPGCNQVGLSWTACSGATSYTVKRCSTKDGTYTVIKSGFTGTSCVDYNVSNGQTYYYKVCAVKNGVEGQECVPQSSIPCATLPSPWCVRDVGTPDEKGGSSYYYGTYTVVGSGNDIWDCNDSFQFAYQGAYGDCSVVARVTQVENTHSWAKAGVMIRESLSSGSEHAFMCLTPGNGAAFQRRTSTGGTSSNNNTTGLTAPYWVKVVRTGNVFTGYVSPNGSTWTQVGQQTIYMGSSVYIGLAVTSHQDGELCTAKFDNVTAKP